MKLKHSVSGVPYIEVDDYNKFIFSSTTRNDQGYKWLVFSGMSTVTTAISSGKGKTKRKTEVVSTNPVSAIIDMDFTNITKYSKTGNPYLTKKYLMSVYDVLKPYVKEGVFPDKNLLKLKDALTRTQETDPEDLMNEDPNGYYEDDDEDDE